MSVQDVVKTMAKMLQASARRADEELQKLRAPILEVKSWNSTHSPVAFSYHALLCQIGAMSAAPCRLRRAFMPCVFSLIAAVLLDLLSCAFIRTPLDIQDVVKALQELTGSPLQHLSAAQANGANICRLH